MAYAIYSYCKAVPVLYSKNIFSFDSYKMLSIFWSIVLPQRLISIQNVVPNVTLCWHGGPVFNNYYEAIFALLSESRNLREVSWLACRVRYRVINYLENGMPA
jgi:hypothetical protein